MFLSKPQDTKGRITGKMGRGGGRLVGYWSLYLFLLPIATFCSRWPALYITAYYSLIL